MTDSKRLLTDSYDFQAYSIGIFRASVCSSLSPDDTVWRMNAEHPSGTMNGWQLATEPTFRGGAPNPSPCHDHPETHKHYLMEC